jgi:YggT family protein
MAGMVVGLGNLILFVLRFASWVLLARVVLSWVSADMRNPLVLLIYRFTDPFMSRVGKVFPALRRMGGFDWTPLLLFLLLTLLEYLIAYPLIEWGATLSGGM